MARFVRVVPCEKSETSETSGPGAGDILQFTTAIYFVEEDEGSLTIDVMRLGNMMETVQVSYYTEDGSAKAGRQYKAAKGDLVFKPNEFRQSIQIETISSRFWEPTLEFKVHLCNAENCSLGNYLGSCRVKVIDGDTFPSSRYKDLLLQGEEGVKQIRAIGLLWQYWKLCFWLPGIGWRTVVILVLDQIRNAYHIFLLVLNIYLVDVLFNLEDRSTQEQLVLPSRRETALAIGGALVVPMAFVHIAGLVKVRLDVVGRLRLFLLCSLFRKYLNYSEESRASVAPADMQTGITRGSLEASDAYRRILDLVAILVQLGVFTYFTLRENPSAIYFVLAMPATMLLYFLLTLCRRDLDEWEDAEMSVLRLVNEACQRYRLIADYFQRPQMNEAFQRCAGDMRRKMIPENTAHLNDDMFPKWLGPIFMGLYIALDANKVLEGEVSLGTFLATLALMKDISGEFSEAYHIVLALTEELGSIRDLTVYFNKETDLLAWKTVNRHRRENTKKARDRTLKLEETDGEEDDVDGVLYKTDLIPIRIEGMRYMRHGDWIFKDVNVEVPQGKLVAVNGPHGSGKATLLRLLGQVVFPMEGSIFIPSHLRVLHVAQEASILDTSPWQNLIFGCGKSVEPERVREVLERMGMKVTLRLLKEELAKPPTTEDWCRDSATDWLEEFTYTEKVKLHLARALLMNPEVLVLQRPLHHYDADTARMVLELLKEHVANRGLALPRGREHRRPRTCFFTVEERSQAEAADVIWRIDDGQVHAT